MAKVYSCNKYSPIIANLHKCNIKKLALCRLLNMSEPRLNRLIADPSHLTVTHIHLMSGMFGMPSEALFYLLVRNKPSLKKGDRWYLDEQINKL